MEPERVVGIFGRNLLDEPGQADGFAELLGRGKHKPFDCVGERAESAAALALLTSHDRWRDTHVVRALAPAADPDGWLEPSPDHCIPPRFEGAARALL